MIDTLFAQKKYEELVPESKDSKAKIFYQFYTRPAATWTCSRQKMRLAIKEINFYREKGYYFDGDHDMSAALIIASCHIGLLLGPLITICCIVVKCRQHCCFKVMLWVTFGVELCLVIPVCVLSNLAYD